MKYIWHRHWLKTGTSSQICMLRIMEVACWRLTPHLCSCVKSLGPCDVTVNAGKYELKSSPQATYYNVDSKIKSPSGTRLIHNKWIRGPNRQTFVAVGETLKQISPAIPVPLNQSTWPNSQFTVIIHLWNLLCKKKLPSESFQTHFFFLAAAFILVKVSLKNGWIHLPPILINIVVPYFIFDLSYFSHN